MGSLYFDNAATSFPKPRIVYSAVKEALIKCAGNPGRSAHREALSSAMAVYEAREAICEYFNADNATKVIFGLNATSILNTAILGISSAGSTFLTSDIEHNAVLRPIAEKCRKENSKFKTFSTSRGSNETTLNAFKKSLTADVKCVVINAASNVDGRILPIVEIGKICKQNGIPYIIDASQLAGHRIIDMQELHCTMLCCAGHKGLYGPMGCGFGIIGDIEAEISPHTYGGNGVNSKDIYMGNELPERYEAGTPAVSTIVGLGAGVKWHMANRSTIIEREIEITNQIFGLLKSIKDLEVVHATGGAPVISFRHNRKGCEEIAEMLSANGVAVRGGFHCAPLAHHSIGTYETGTVRISPSLFNTTGDCKYLTECLMKI